MATIKLLPIIGIDNVNADDDLFTQGQNGTVNYLKDAVNVDIHGSGKLSLVKDSILATDKPFKDLWQSPLHHETFGRLGGDWVKIAPGWTHETLADIGDKTINHIVLNNRVIVAGKNGLFSYDGNKALPLTIDTPPSPQASVIDGNMDKGVYLFAIAWLRGFDEKAEQSAVSAIASIKLDGKQNLNIMLPLCFDSSITGVRVFVSHADGANLYRLGDYPINTAEVIATNAVLGQAEFVSLSPMPTGDYMDYWRGRLITAKSNIIRFSQPLAYHVHDERFDFVLLPQRISFLAIVDGGIWVGQHDHVLFLSGTNPNELVVQNKGRCYPIKNSHIMLPPEVVGDMASGIDSVLWLSNKGYMLGFSTGQAVELQSKHLVNITANNGKSVRFKDRVVTAVL